MILDVEVSGWSLRKYNLLTFIQIKEKQFTWNLQQNTNRITVKCEFT